MVSFSSLVQLGHLELGDDTAQGVIENTISGFHGLTRRFQ